MSKKAKLLIERLSVEETDDYDKLQTALLAIYRVTAAKHQNNFENASKFKGDSWAQFACRLKLLLEAYLRSRQCVDFAGLFDLIVADKLKKCLEADTLEFVRLQAINKSLTCSEIADLADSYADQEVKQNFSRFNKWHNRGGGNNSNSGDFRQNHDGGKSDSSGEESPSTPKSPSKSNQKSNAHKGNKSNGNGSASSGGMGAAMATLNPGSVLLTLNLLTLLVRQSYAGCVIRPIMSRLIVQRIQT